MKNGRKLSKLRKENEGKKKERREEEDICMDEGEKKRENQERKQ